MLLGLSRDFFHAVYFPDSHGLDSVHSVLFEGSTPSFGFHIPVEPAAQQSPKRKND
jgi:hypothetical protein